MITALHPHLSEEDLNRLPSNRNATLAELSGSAPVVMVFLRHLGCPFCREMLTDLQAARSHLEERGAVIALVHMASDSEAEQLFTRYGLQDLPRFMDRERKLYRAFGLRRATVGQIFGPKTWQRAFKAGILEGHRMGRPQGNGFQMPGVFLVDQGVIVAGHPHLTVHERPNFMKLLP